MLREVASKLSRTNPIRMGREETDNIPSKFIISNDIYPPGSKPFFRPVPWRSRRKRGMLIRTRKRATDVHSSNASFSKWRPVTRPISARRKIFSSWNLKKSNSVLLVRRAERCWGENRSSFAWRISRHCPKPTDRRYSVRKSSDISLGEDR